ncbi:hypothetical protein [Jannaschia sp. LMIT008]|uniref:hypothetical protein n=1 Tax=Jannaschia maritima TaxID=3032585 RepID=UPI002810DD83|nr:hypothetical protein [Jannaschia sp. LMIT008]
MLLGLSALGVIVGSALLFVRPMALRRDRIAPDAGDRPDRGTAPPPEIDAVEGELDRDCLLRRPRRKVGPRSTRPSRPARVQEDRIAKQLERGTLPDFLRDPKPARRTPRSSPVEGSRPDRATPSRPDPATAPRPDPASVVADARIPGFDPDVDVLEIALTPGAAGAVTTRTTRDGLTVLVDGEVVAHLEGLDRLSPGSIRLRAA